MNRTLLPLAVYTLFLISPPASFAWQDDGDWDYYGSGRDHPYSQYIDRANYVGPADYSRLRLDYVEPPPPVAIPLPPVVPGAPLDSFVINIPNRFGGYIAVVIQRTANGYIGPKGEFYPEFPKVFQLEMKYGR
jgi:hypothetical protein